MCKCEKITPNCLFCKECYEQYLQALDYEKYIFYLLHTLHKDILYDLTMKAGYEEIPIRKCSVNPIDRSQLARRKINPQIYIMKYLDSDTILDFISHYTYTPTIVLSDAFIFKLNNDFNKVIRDKYIK